MIYTNVAAPVGVQFKVTGGLGYTFDLTDPTFAEMGTLYLSDLTALVDVWKTQIKGAFLFVPGFTSWSSAVTISNAVVGLPDGFAFNPSALQVVTTNSGLFLGPNVNLNCAHLNLMSNSLFRMGATNTLLCSQLTLQRNAKFRMLDHSSLTCAGAISVGSNATLSLHANSSLSATGDISVLFATNSLLQMGAYSTLTCGGSLLLDKGQLLLSTSPLLNCSSHLTLTNGATFTLYSGPTNDSVPYGAYVGVTGDMALGSTSWIYPYAHPTNGGR